MVVFTAALAFFMFNFLFNTWKKNASMKVKETEQ